MFDTNNKIIFRSPISNTYLTRALFYEAASYLDRSYAIYTLAKEDKLPYKSFHKLYMSYEDPTEINIALNLFESYEHWKRLCESTWFKPYLLEYREELELRLKAKALSNIMEHAKNEGSKSNYEANKYLLTAGWKTPSAKKTGRPSKEAISEEANELFRAQEEAKEDLARIRLVS